MLQNKLEHPECNIASGGNLLIYRRFWKLRQWMHFADEDSLVRASRDKLPGNVLSMSLKNIWDVIKEQKDLNLPAHKVLILTGPNWLPNSCPRAFFASVQRAPVQVMVANVRCGEIMREKLEALRQNSVWQELSEQSSRELLPNFGMLSSELLHASLAGKNFTFRIESFYSGHACTSLILHFTSQDMMKKPATSRQRSKLQSGKS